MDIKKFTGKTKEEAIEAAKLALGNDERVVTLPAKRKKPEGLIGIFKPAIWEVSAFREEDTDGSVEIINRTVLPTSTFSVKADENIDIFAMNEQSNKSVENDLKDAFREISQVFEKAEEKNVENKPIVEKKEPIKVKKEEKPIKEDTKEAYPINEVPIYKKEEVSMKQSKSSKPSNNLPVVKMVYNTLLNNEVDERYINSIFDDMGNVLTSANSLDSVISNIYQKMVLKLGTPMPINISGKGPLVVFFIGPTGVGKTTTIAKIASEFKYERGMKVSLIAADSYRIGAMDQLNNYANIMDIPMEIIVESNDINEKVESLKDQDLILVDTAGFSHKNLEQKEATRKLLNALDNKYKSEKFLVLSVTTKYDDLKEISDAFKEICDYKLIFTKLDETNAYGNILNIKMRTNAPISYITNGQNVPDDIETVDPQSLVRTMLGG